MLLYTGREQGLGLTLAKALERATETPPAEAPTGAETTTAKLFLNTRHGLEPLLAMVLGRVPAGSQLILSLGLDFTEETPLAEQDLQVLQAVLERAAQAGCGLGVSDLSAARLRQLQAHVSPLRIQVDQIDASECCTLPPEILQLASETGVQLLAHHDQEPVLGPEELAALRAAGRSADDWGALLRTTALHTDRQVVAYREYVLWLP